MIDSLKTQQELYIQRKFLAMPIAGTIAWFAIGVCGLLTDDLFTNWVSVFAATGSIFYLAMGVAWLTGEDLLGRRRENTIFDKFFLLAVAQANAVYAIAIPFFLVDRTSLPMTTGILLGLMWIPFSASINHWIGYAHALLRTALVLYFWYAMPEHRFVAIPFAIVGVYLLSIAVLARRHRRVVEEHRLSTAC